MQESILSTTGRRHCPFYRRFFLKGIALIELLGAILLAPVFIKDFGVGKRDLVWCFSFHFCFLQRRL